MTTRIELKVIAASIGVEQAGRQRKPHDDCVVCWSRWPRLYVVIEGVRYEVEPAVADCPVSAVPRLVRWLCEMSLARRRGAGGLGRLSMW